MGSPIELVLQTFLRFTSLALLPNLVCSTAIYFLVCPHFTCTHDTFHPFVYSLYFLFKYNAGPFAVTLYSHIYTHLYLLYTTQAVPYSKYDPWVFSQITTIAISINHTWIALVIFVLTAQPGFAHRISPVLSAIAGFAGGFFVPPKLMPPW